MKRLLWLALLLACVVVPLGAFVRLSDAGLGCPDWPGCYGELSPHHAAEPIREAMLAQPDGPVSPAKAWKEMIHRYLAATLGLLVLTVAILAWRRRQHRWAATGLLGLLVLQGLLGMWTVTLLLKPAIVTAHLLGGMSIVALLATACLAAPAAHPVSPGIVWLLRGLPLLVLAQIALGGWVSSNYAALACQGLPACNGAWWPSAMQFDGAFHWQRALGESADGTPLLFGQLVAIHWLHRVGAVVVAVSVVYVIVAAWPARAIRGRLALLAGSLLLQIGLGAANVWWQLPLPLAVAHNAGAMLLLAASLSLAASVVPVSQAWPHRLSLSGRKGRRRVWSV